MGPAMSRPFALVSTLALILAACEDDALNRLPEEPPAPDAGVAPPPPDAGFTEPDAGIAPAREAIYVNTGDTLFSYDQSTNLATPIGAFMSDRGPVTDMADIAIDLEGRMFGGSVTQEVWQIDPATARCTLRFAFDDRLNGLTFLADGTLVVAGDRVSLVEPTSGRVIRELVGIDQYQTSGDIVGLPDGMLYWTVRGGQNEMSDLVVRLDPNTGRATELGLAGVERIYGLGYAESVLYGFSRDGVVVRLDPRNGEVMRQQSLSQRWWGATTNPVRWP